MRLVAQKHLRRKGAGPRIEKGSEFDTSECVHDAENLIQNGWARKADEKEAADPTKDELYEKAKKLNIKGRSDMRKDELTEAVNDPENIEAWRQGQKKAGRSNP